MYERKESKSGSYYPAFLCLDVNTPDDLWYWGRYPIDERTEAVFLHEFIHYLQVMTTVSPWLNESEEDLPQCSFSRLWATFGFNRVKLKI